MDTGWAGLRGGQWLAVMPACGGESYHRPVPCQSEAPGVGGADQLCSVREAQLACSELVLAGCEDLSSPGTF